MDLSVAIITKNEERNLARCLSSLPDGVEIVVVDSFSTDKTEQIAKTFGSKFFTHTFKNYSDQKNFAIAKCTGAWVLSLDADEALDASLKESIMSFVRNQNAQNPNTYFKIKRRLSFMGKELRFGKSIDFPIRLAPRMKMRFVGDIHEQLDLTSNIKLGLINSGSLIHESYSDLDDYFTKFNKYTALLAEKHFKNHRKISIVRVVARPWFEFFLRYIIRGGFLDGYPGYCYALLSSLYTFVKYAKIYEQNSR